MINNKELNKKNQNFLILIGFITIIILSSMLTFSFPVLITQLLLSSITLPLIFKKNYRFAKLYLVIFLISTIFLFLVYFANQSYYGEPYYIGGSDDLKFEQWGYDVYRSEILDPYNVLESGVIGIYHNSPFFAVYMSLLFRFSNIFGKYTTFLPRIINIYFLIWICMIVEYLLCKYAKFTDKKIYFSIALFAFMPNIQYINSHVFRDTFNLLQILLIIFLFDKIIERNNIISKALNVAALYALMYFTYYTRANSLAFAGVIIFLILGEHFKIKKRYLVILILPLILMSDIFEILRLRFFIESYSRYVSNIAEDGLSKFIFRKPLLPIGVFLRALYAFITPFPNFFGLFNNIEKILFDLTIFLTYLGVLVQILGVPFIIKRIMKFDWLSLSFLSWFIAVIITTFTFRHIILYYPFMTAVAVDGFCNAQTNNRRIILVLSGFTAVCFGLMYISLKLFN